MNAVVPDSITPVIGWKAFDIEGDRLISPQQSFLWPPMKRAEARCIRPAGGSFRWTAEPRKDPEPPEPVSTGIIHSMTLFSRVLIGEPAPPQPQIILPNHLEWQVQWVPNPPHEAVSDNCSCGFHLAKDALVAKNYGSLLTQVAGWGRVIEGDAGWRVQYAYPIAFYVSSKKILEGLADYGVPIIEDETPLLTNRGVQWRYPVTVLATSAFTAAALIISSIR